MRGRHVRVPDPGDRLRPAGLLRRSLRIRRPARQGAVRVIRVVDGGVSTTVQDAGRFGLYHIGMPPSGALDDFSFRVANLLVGNDEDAAALEATYNGPRLEIAEDTVVAVTGADLPVRVDGEERPAW